MELPNRKPNRVPGFDYSQNGAYFITICTKERKKLLSQIAVGTPLLGCPKEPYPELMRYGEVANKYILQLNEFYDCISVDKYVIMPDHIHLLLRICHKEEHPRTGASTERTSVIARFVGTFKRFCNKEYAENIWQDRYYDHVIRNQQDYDEIWHYIENNPAKWILNQREYE